MCSEISANFTNSLVFQCASFEIVVYWYIFFGKVLGSNRISKKKVLAWNLFNIAFDQVPGQKFALKPPKTTTISVRCIPFQKYWSYFLGPTDGNLNNNGLLSRWVTGKFHDNWLPNIWFCLYTSFSHVSYLHSFYFHLPSEEAVDRCSERHILWKLCQTSWKMSKLELVFSNITHC